MIKLGGILNLGKSQAALFYVNTNFQHFSIGCKIQ
jgi:hypothetical protein